MMQSGFSLNDLQRMDKDKLRQMYAQALLSGGGQQQQIAHPMQGMAQMGQAAMAGNQMRNQSFPSAPGGGRPSMGMNLMNMVTRGNNGGMY